MMFRIVKGTGIAAICAVGCGGSTPASPPAATAGEPTETAPPAAAAPSEEPAADLESESPARAAPLNETAATNDATDPDEQSRRVLYRMTNEGLVVEIDGVEFRPTAKPVKFKGGWAVDVRVKATATDERVHRLLSPENGPLMFAAKIEKNGKIETIADQRVGEDETFVQPGDSTELQRTFPAGKLAPLWGGQSLTLYVGLWGLAADEERRRPVRKLFVLKMVTGSGTPQPVITPPE